MCTQTALPISTLAKDETMSALRAQHTAVAEQRSALPDLVGNTPLIRLAHVTADLAADVEVYLKAEWYNPGSSVKDRAALWMIHAGERSGALRPGMRIADAT